MTKLHLEASNLSFWLIPAKDDRQVLKTIIDQLAHTYDCVSFCPHVTLFTLPTAVVMTHYAAVTRSEGTVLSLINWQSYLRSAISRIPSFSLRAETIQSGEAFAKTVFVQLELTSTLLRSIDHLRQAVTSNTIEGHIDPHISLIYGAFTPEKKQAIAHGIRIPQQSILFKEIQVVQAPTQFETSADVGSLRCLYAQSLLDA